jgi:hypothetical protein
MGDHRCGARGSNVPLSVLVVRFGCRSRQAARGPLRPRAKSLRITRLGLASRCESMTSGEEAPEAEFRWLNRGIGGGLPTNRSCTRKRRLLGSTLSVEDAPGRESCRPLTGRRWKRFWFLERGSGYRVLAGYDRERQRHPSPTLHAVDKAVAREHRPERCSVLLGNDARAVSGGAEARWAPSSAHRPGAALPQGSSAPAPRKSAEVHPCWVNRSGAWLSVGDGESVMPRNRTIHGCTCRMSVAEVGEKHLSLAPAEVSREASPGGER